MIDPNQVGAAPKPPQEDAQATNTGNPSVYQQANQQQYFDAFNQIEGLSPKDKLDLLNAKGFDPESNYNLIMDDYNNRREKELQDMEQMRRRQADLEASNEDLKKKDSSLESSAEGLESGGAEFEDQAFGQQVAVADPFVFDKQRADESLIGGYMASQEAFRLREEARYEEDLQKKNELMAQARKSSAQAHVQNQEAARSLNRQYESKDSAFRLNPESSADMDFMFRSMVQRAKEDDEQVRKDFGYLGIEDRADLEEFKMLGGETDNLGRNLQELRDLDWDGSYGFERLYDDFYTVFGSGSISMAAGAADMLGGLFGVDSDDNNVAKYYRNKNRALNARNQRSKEKGMEELGIPEDYRNLNTLDTFLSAASGDLDAAKKFVAIDFPGAIGMVAAEAALFFGTRGAGKGLGKATGLARLLPAAGKGAQAGQALSIGQRVAGGAAASLGPTLLSYIPRGYESYREEHPEASMGQAAFFGVLSGAAEGMMSALMLGAGRGAQAAFQRTFTREGMKASVKKEVANALRKKGGSPFLGDIAGEGLEEGFVAYTEELINVAGDVLNGKDVRDVSIHAIADAAFVGMLGGSGPATLSAGASGLSHSKNLKNSQVQAQIVTQLRKEYESEKDPKKKAAARTAYASALKKYEMIKQKDQEMYETLSDAEVDELMNTHQEIANISSTVKKGTYLDGAEVTKEDKAQMKARLETLFERKAQIESQAENRAFRESIPDPIVVPDVEERPREAAQRTLDESEVKQHKALPEAKESAPADVAQEEGQLMLFDENTMDDMVQRPGEPESTRSPEPPAEKKPTTPEAEQTEQEAPEAEAEAEAEQEAPEAEAKPEQEAAPVEEDALEVDLASEKPIDISDSSIVGDGAGQISIQNASAINRLIKAFGKAFKKTGVKLKAHRTMDSFYNLNEEVRKEKGYIEVRHKDGWLGGYYDPTTQTVHINPLSDTMDVMEEIGHFALFPVIGKDAESREALYKEFEKLSKGKSKGAKRLKQIFDQNLQDYAGKPEAVKQEEGIISFLVQYARDPKQFSTIADRVIAAINRVIKRAGVDSNIITGKEGLFELAEKFKRAADGEFVDIQVAKTKQKADQAPAQETAEEAAPVAEEAPAEEAAPEAEKRTAEEIAADETLSEAEKRKAIEAVTNELLKGTAGIFVADGDVLADAASLDSFRGRMSVRRKKDFNYLKDTEIFYESRPYIQPDEVPVVSSRYNTFVVNRSIKVNDYFHFRNWYNKVTGNQIADRVGRMYYIKDGQKYIVKPPKPRVDKDGRPVRMPLPPTPKQRVKASQIEAAEDQKGVLQQVKELNDGNRKLFAQLPWKGLVNAGQFRPATKPVSEMSPNEMYVASLIEKKNLEAALEMGLTKEQVQDRLESQGRDLVVGLSRAQDGDLVNATGLSPFEESVDSQPVGMFAIRTKPQIVEATKGQKGVFKTITDSARSFFGATEEGSLDELKGVFGIIMGYDRTGKRRKGVTSGIRALLNMPDNTLSTHVDSRTARRIQERFYNKALQIWEASGRQKTKGEFFIGFSTLNPEATLGNPDVFEAMYDTLLDMVEKGEMSPAEFVSGFNATAMPSLIYALDNHSDASASMISRILIRDGNKYSFDPEAEITNDQVALIVEALKGQHKNFRDSFSSRKKFFSDVHASKFLDKVGAPKKSKIQDRVSAHYNDTDLDGVESATLTAFKKFEYEIEFGSDGKPKRLKGLEVDRDSKLGFAGILRTPKSSPLKHMKDLFRLEDIDPDYKFKSDLKGAKKAQEEAKTPRERALLANQYSLFEFNSDVQDIDMTQLDENGEMPDSGGRASIRTGMRSAPTSNGTWAMREMNGFQKWRNKWLRRLQDKYIDIFNLQDTIEAARGRRAKDQDFRMAEELMYGKAAEDLNRLDQKVDKITDLMKEKGFTVEDISDYLYALHAVERNNLISDRTEGKVKDGSGMSDGKAQEILNRYESQKAEMQEIIDLVREIQQDTRDTMVKFGLESQEAIDAFEAQFENYVPLSGIAIDEETSFTSSYPTGGAGFSVFGPSTKRAEGRKSEATNILAQIIAQNSSTHIKARTNEALQSLYNLVENNPNKDVWQILDGSKVNSQDPHIVAVRVNGEQKFIRFKDASYAETLRNMNLPQTSIFVRLLRAPSNWLRRSFTTLNPEFMISNFSRDIQAAMFNAAAEADIPGGIVEGQGIVAEMLKNVPTTLKTLLRSESPKNLQKLFDENPEFERYYEDFKADGGKTGWSYARPLDQIAKDLQDKSSDKTKLQEALGKAENFAQLVEGYNDAFENSIRLAAYIAARQKGVTREKAAQLAKNITVNFNKSGEYGQLLNSVYLFFNASVQGTARLGKSLLTMKPPTRPDGSKVEWYNRFNNAQKMAAALTVFSGLAAMMAMGMSDEDEDGELYYNKIPDYIKERNLIIMRPNGRDYFKIPLPYGFSMFANLGSTAVEVGYGHKQIDTAMMQLSSSFMNSFSPISFGQSKDLFTKAGKSLVPTVFKPLADVMTNETYFGGPVYSENLPFGVQRPESSMSFRSPESVQQFFRWMNEATGGSVDVKGDLDFNPDKMWYMFEYFIGGAGKFVTRSGQAARKLAAKVEDNDFRIEANDIPFARILYGEPSKYMDREDYSRRKNEIQSLYKELRNNPRKDKPQRYRSVGALNEALKSYEKMLQSIRKSKRAALNIEDYTERMKRIQELQDKERSVVMRFNKQYEKLRGQDK